ncbi:MAG: GxxExxY protein [Candidatus Doudnabacteria bacterium]|nr:GxxExxY protein [Candidatus Doudnabacteria bacterium]
MDTDNKQKNTDLLFNDLTYKIRGAIFTVSNTYGKGLKEIIYQKALAEEFNKLQIKFEQQKRININSLNTGKILGTFIPDFVVEDKIIIEIKATDFTIEQAKKQQLSYLKASKYEVGFLVNFCSSPLYLKRQIYTNDRKAHICVNP